ncbi:Hypothetical predicted protein [Pelobates cultripes]|uniref:Uncharacterized protein n=1 Tax=Pelobates cultripes TaxID=61616 RepID=A0AAD1VN29_PELCU|nr:Hypothetical predicted protein [Pelobates cultripes]
MEATNKTRVPAKTNTYLLTGNLYNWIRLRCLFYQHHHTSFFRGSFNTTRGNRGHSRQKRQAADLQRDPQKKPQGQGVSKTKASKTALIQEMKSQRAHRLTIQSIWSQFLRVRRIVSDDNIVNERLTDFSKKFLDKGYHERPNARLWV